MSTILSFIELVPVTFLQSLMLVYIVLAIAIPFRFLGFSDLTSEGSFPLGGALCGTLLLAGVNPFMATFLCFISGCIVGVAVGSIHRKLKVHPLLSGILVVTMLYSITLKIMGKPNISVLEAPTIYSSLGISQESITRKIGFLGAIIIILYAILFVPFRSRLGLRLRAIGKNEKMAQAQGASVLFHTLLGLALANGLSSLSGSLVVQSQGYSDIGMGFGILMNGLAAMMLGEYIIKPTTLLRQLGGPILGTLVFYQIISLSLCLGLQPSDLKLMTGLFVLLILAIPSLRLKTSPLWLWSKQ